LTAALVMLVASGSTQPDTTFVAGVRGDGSMIPIAIFDGRTWWDRWPSAHDMDGRGLPVPASLDAIPVDWLPPGMRLPTEWLLQRANGTRTRIRAERPIRSLRVETDSDGAIGLQTDYRDRAGDADGGIAIAGSGTLGRFIAASTVETERLLAQLPVRLRTVEEEAIALWREGDPSTRDDDHAETLTQVFRAGFVAEPPFQLLKAEQSFKALTYYHLVGQKLYAMNSTDPLSCKMNLSFEGVITATRDGRIVSEGIQASGWSEFCGDAVERILPLATLQLKDRLFWVVLVGLEDGSGYMLFDPNVREEVGLRKHPFIRVPVAPADEGCSRADLCRVHDELYQLVEARPPTGVAPLLASAYRPQPDDRADDRDLVPALRDPASPAWPALARALKLGGRISQWGSDLDFCAPWARTGTVSDKVEAFGRGAGTESRAWVVSVASAKIHEQPSEQSAVIAEAGHELIAVVEGQAWHAPDAMASWAKVTWDGRLGFMRRANLNSPDDPSVCLRLDGDAWRIILFHYR